MDIGFIGLGLMGSPMVKRLLSHSLKVRVFDLNTHAIALLENEGAIRCSSIADLATESDIVFTMVQTGQQVQQCCLGSQGIFAHLKKGGIFIDSSSIEITISKELHKEAQRQGIAMIDAPVSGGVAAAQQGSLTFMVGGTEGDFHDVKLLLSYLGKNIIYAGPAGSGVAAKICNNMMLGINMIAVCEGFALANKLDLAPEKFFEIASMASGQSWSLTHYCPWPGIMENIPSNHNYEPGFMAKMMLKDLKLSQEAADFVALNTPMADQARELYQEFVNRGNEEKDFSGIVKMYV